jgi:uncharacterized protein (DUF1697 family)
MASYVCLLRGINVSGHKKILMADLRELCEKIGLDNVESYLQSGNLVLDAGRSSPSKVADAIEDAVRARFGFDVPILARRARDMRRIVLGNPFRGHSHIDESKLHVVFLASRPPLDAAPNIESLDPGQDEFALVGTHMYLHCPNGYADTRLSNNALERRLGVATTTRNWKTVNALAEMAASR